MKQIGKYKEVEIKAELYDTGRYFVLISGQAVFGRFLLNVDSYEQALERAKEIITLIKR